MRGLSGADSTNAVSRRLMGGALGVLMLMGVPAGVEAQGEGTLDIPVLRGPITLDGRVDDAAWRSVQPLDMTMYIPVFRGDATEESVIRIAHDGDNLWISGRFHDSDPSALRINSLYRDRWSGDDVLAVFIDPFNDNQNGLWFMTSPAGIRLDAELSDDGRSQNLSWNTYWDVESRVDDEGWTTEIRIPFSSLGFQADGEEVVMGLALTRLDARRNERTTFPAIDPQFGFRQPSVFQDVRLTGVQAQKPIYLTTYGAAASSRTPTLADGASAYSADVNNDAEFGVDAKVNLSGNLTLDLTVNPDFAQVEADDQQINLTRFSLFFPEKRQFFQERSATFNLSSGTGTRIFHSRNIGLSSAREPVRILGGGRLVGRVGDWDVGLLNMQTEGVPGGDPSTNFGVARLRRRVLNDNSTLGAIMTTRLGAEGTDNKALAVDGVFRIFANDYVASTFAASQDERTGTSFGDADSKEVDVMVYRPASRGLQYTWRYTWTGGDYRPGLGFITRPGVSGVNLYTQYWIYLSEESPIRYVLPGSYVTRYTRHSDNSLQSAAYRLWVTVAWKDGSSGYLEPEYFVEDVRNPFALGDGVMIPAGRYEFGHLLWYYSTRPGRLARVSAFGTIGDFYDGTRLQIGVDPTWNVSSHLELGASVASNFIDFKDRGQSLNTHLVRLRVEAALNVKTSATAFVQWNSNSDQLAANLRLRHNFREGNDLWLVFNQGLTTDRDPFEPGQPDQPLRGPSTLIVKYTWTFGS